MAVIAPGQPAPADHDRPADHSARRVAKQQGQALVEVALVIPVLLLLVLGVVALEQVLQAQLGVSAVAREAAHVAATAGSPAEAAARGLARGQEVAAGYRLGNGSLVLTVDAGSLQRGGQVVASAHYTVAFAGLPPVDWGAVTVSSTHAEQVGLYRSRW